MSSSYSPTVVEGESPATLWFEKSLFVGEFLAAVAYGLHLAVFSITAYFLVLKPAKGKVSWPFVAYVVILLACGTINLGSGIKFAEMAWIDFRDIPGGPAAFNTIMYSDMVESLGNAAYITANFLADGLLIWRCFVVYGRNYWVMIIPILAFMASTALSILTLFQAAQPMASIWSHSAVVIAVPYWSLSIALNATVSLMIVCRMLWHRHIIGRALGPRQAAVYTGIATMFIESAALYAITGLVYIVCFARNSNVQNLVLGILSQTECIAPELIILRVALGRAWSAERSSTGVSTGMVFGSNTKKTGEASVLADMFRSSAVTDSGDHHTSHHVDMSDTSDTQLGVSSDVPKSIIRIV